MSPVDFFYPREHPEEEGWEYCFTLSPRKGDGKDPEGEGWIPDAWIQFPGTYIDGDGVEKPFPNRAWEREDFFDVEYWKRRVE